MAEYRECNSCGSMRLVSPAWPRTIPICRCCGKIDCFDLGLGDLTDDDEDNNHEDR